MSPEPTIRASAPALAVRMAGLSVREARQVLGEVGIDPGVLDDPEADAPLRGHVALLERLAERLDAPLFGLRAGLATSPRELGVLGYVMMASRDVSAAIGQLVRFFAVHQDGTDLSVLERDDLVHIGYRIRDPTIAPRRQDAEYTVGVALAAHRFLFGPDFAPTAVWLEHGPPADLAEVRALFGVTPRYGAPYNAVLIDRALLGHALPSHDPGLFGILERHAEALLAQRSDARSWSAQVRAVLAERLRDGAPSLEDVAQRLAVSPATLRRRLREEETSFADELTAVRRALAERYLTDPTLSLSEVAFLLGFSEASAFSRAFGRWERTTPKAYRHARLWRSR